MKRGTTILGIVFIVLSIYFYVLTLDFPNTTAQTMGPSFWPRIIIPLVIVLSLIMIFYEWSHQSKPLENANVNKVVLGIVSLIVFVILTPFLGFFLTGYLFLLAITWVMDTKSLKVLLIYPSVLTIFVYVVFYKILRIYFPVGKITGF